VRIAVVCAEALTRSVAEIILTGAGHAVVPASSMHEGLVELARASTRGPRIDLLLVDGALPAAEATVLCHATLASDAPWAIVLANDPEEASAALAAGAIEVVAKPVMRDVLLASLERVRPYLAPSA